MRRHRTRNRRGLPVESQAIEGLNDIDYGLWQWKTHDEVRRGAAGFL